MYYNADKHEMADGSLLVPGYYYGGPAKRVGETVFLPFGVFFGGSARFAHAYTLRHAENIPFHASSNHFGDWPGWQSEVAHS